MIPRKISPILQKEVEMSENLQPIEAIHAHEERYEKLELVYHNAKERAKIFEAMKDLKWRSECDVTVTDVEEGNDHGFVCIEFHDDYDKEAGPYFEALMKRLGIDHCE